MSRNITALVSSVLILIAAASNWIHFPDVVADEAVGLAIIEDIKGDRMGVEPTSSEIWDKLVELYHNKEEMWIGGPVEVFIFIRPDPNYSWGFRFKPENITVAEVTAEGLQTTIRGISEDVDYWIRIGQAYVHAKVMEVYLRGKTGDITGPDGYPDGKCDMRDIGAFQQAFGSTSGDPRWNTRADINIDGKIDIKDIGIAVKNFVK